MLEERYYTEMTLRPFRVSKPIVGMVHLKPLPGSPMYGGDFRRVVDSALEDAGRLVDGGVDGLLVENYWDMPYQAGKAASETVASMAVITAKIVDEFGVPVGVNVLRNDAEAALAVAAASGARFVRVNVYGGAYVSMEGLLVGEAREILKLRSLLHVDAEIWADIRVKHAWPLTQIPIGEEALDVYGRCLADALILTGRRTGTPPERPSLEAVRRAVPDAPLVIGSGLNPENAVELLRLADGAIVGTYFKEDGVIGRPVDVDRVRRLMDAVEPLRRGSA